MNVRFPSSLTALSLAFLLSGCGIARVTETERATSFGKFEELKVDGEFLRNHLLLRSALVTAGGRSIKASDASAQDSISFEFIASKPFFGTAAAIDRRGYFATAAHCVEGDEISLLIAEKNGFSVAEARVVFRGESASMVSDFAILHVDRKLDRVFQWAVDVETGDPVVSAGISEIDRSGEEDSAELTLGLSPIGGAVIDKIPADSLGANYEIILHDSPVVHGNSGGPLVDRQGRLIAINFTGAAKFPSLVPPRFRYANAVRLSPEKVREIIETDVASRE